MNKPDFHPECSHCIDIPNPLWPVEDREAWIMECCYMQAITEDTERLFERSRQQKIAYAKKESDKAAEKQKRLRDQKAKFLSTIKERRSGLLNINYGGITHMAKTKTEGAETVTKSVKKTGLVDQLIRQSANGGYGEGEKEAIVAAVAEQFPGEDVKRLAGLFFSRRSQIKKSQEAQAAA